MADQLPVVAVVDSTSEGTVVWWVNVGPAQDVRTGRLCGAWIVDPQDSDTLRNLTVGRICVLTADGSAAMAAASVEAQLLLDLAETRQAAVTDVDHLQDAFEAEQATRPAAKQLTPIRWPVFREPIDVNAPPTAGPETPFRALLIARWLVDLCGQWGDLEGQRLSRAPLRELAGDQPRPLPLSLSTTAS